MTNGVSSTPPVNEARPSIIAGLLTNDESRAVLSNALAVTVASSSVSRRQ